MFWFERIEVVMIRIPISFVIISVAVICMMMIFFQATSKRDIATAPAVVVQEVTQPWILARPWAGKMLFSLFRPTFFLFFFLSLKIS